ncbi:MAG: ABC transporter ATP-binding protein [Erysipelotrichales bacterium]|nr:ABC transporter ATP-binding protein [Erysipelotrichales bacterium]
MLKIHNLTKAFQNHVVLNQLSLNIEDGELVYIYGINGSGKSTLFKIICGILEQEEGEIQLNDDAYIGALIENPGFLDSETLRYNLQFLASLKKIATKEKIEHLCQEFHLDYYQHSPMKTFSLGMRQKAGIIQAIMENQNFILLDEPTRGLDKEAIDMFCQYIIKLHNEGKTIIIASHDFLNQLPFDHIYHLKNGELLLDENF